MAHHELTVTVPADSDDNTEPIKIGDLTITPTVGEIQFRGADAYWHVTSRHVDDASHTADEDSVNLEPGEYNLTVEW